MFQIAHLKVWYAAASHEINGELTSELQARTGTKM
jgi:hypothetical protein